MNSTPSTTASGAKRQPKYIELRELIRRQIEAGELNPGDAIQTEPELAQTYQVSVSTVKEALKDLVKDGLIVRTRGRGTFVSDAVRSKQRIFPVITPFLGSGFTRTFYLGFEERCNSLGLTTALLSERQCASQNSDWRSHHLMKNAQGAAVMTAASNAEVTQQEVQFIMSLLDAGLKVVLVDQELPGLELYRGKFIFLGLQNLEPMRDMGRHLIEQGYRRLGFIGMDDHSSTQRQRLSGLRLAVAESNGVELLEPLYLGTDFYARHDRWYEPLPEDKAQQIVDYARRCDALCAINDLIGAFTIRALADHGLSVPGDCAVTGFEDSEIASMTNPALTTISLPLREMGARAAEFLANLQEDRLGGHGRWLMDYKLIYRASSKR